jgi:hypothetical protein
MWEALFGVRVALVEMVNQGQVLVLILPVPDNALVPIAPAANSAIREAR